MPDIVEIFLVTHESHVKNSLSKVLDRIPGCRAMGYAAQTDTSLDMLHKYKPQAVLLDMELPDNGALDFLTQKAEMGDDTPVFILTEPGKEKLLLTFEALRLGALDFIARPSRERMVEIETVIRDLKEKTGILHRTCNAEGEEIQDEDLHPRPLPRNRGNGNGKHTGARGRSNKIRQVNAPINLVAMGLSIGGLRVLIEMLPNLSRRFKVPMLVVQQLPSLFTTPLAEALSELCHFEVLEARHHHEIIPGKIYLAPGDRQMGVIQCDGRCLIEVTYTDHVSGQLPSIDYLFRSLADIYGKHTLSMLLSGTGKDGVSGMRLLRSKGALTISQDKDSAVAYEKATLALEQGIIDEVVPLRSLHKRVNEIVNLSHREAAAVVAKAR